jgi:hypothetical protein
VAVAWASLHTLRAGKLGIKPDPSDAILINAGPFSGSGPPQLLSLGRTDIMRTPLGLADRRTGPMPYRTRSPLGAVGTFRIEKVSNSVSAPRPTMYSA